MALENTNLFRLPYFTVGGGLTTELGSMLPRGAKAIYVRSTGVQSQDDQSLARKILPTLAAGLAECRAGMGDTVYCLPGHSESVTDNTMLTNLVAGTRIVGLGDPYQDDAPTFRWTNTAGQWPITVKNVSIQGLRLMLEGANGITKAIVTTAAATKIQANYIQVASGATAKSTIAIEIGSAAHYARLLNNYICGTETHNVTDGIKIVGATAPSDVQIMNNTMIFSATAANGNIDVTVASKRMQIINNILYNTHTSSSTAITVGAVAADGVIAYNVCGVVNTGAATSGTVGIKFGAGALFTCFQNFVANDPLASGLLSPTVDT